ncbi:hypothetical protein [Deinococcus arenicola]|uniref:Uncharacterized protein n=1 Tax=Deinococcus arenicola TaxID=2994950 RepID=A0ABU4DX46_9DEIO|nr:hypothetical protein [Deinococcus sp. ZS9-10]MDV6376460.1 hypothetical protein [Deinococcus sp. ZS9-10]
MTASDSHYAAALLFLVLAFSAGLTPLSFTLAACALPFICAGVRAERRAGVRVGWLT